MASIHDALSPGATPFAIYEDAENEEPLSPSDMFEGDISEATLSRADEAASNADMDQEHESEPEPYRSSLTARRPQSRTSGATHYSFISAMPSETSATSKPVSPTIEASEARYTPRKERPRFRNPESVRALQMSSPQLLPAYESSRDRVKAPYKAATPSRTGRPETPASRRSASHRSARDHHSPRQPPVSQQAPLVLLHVTILPMQVPFAHDMMARVMPDWLVENYRLLEEKLQDIILMRRGLLIPHPRDEYELLEERILESLELKIPRLLKCGHFVAPEDDSDKEEEEEDVGNVSDEGTGRGSRMSGGTMTEEHECKEDARDATMCHDCHRELKKPGKGVGAGTRKWDIKIYAANGLMRSEAWGAAWSEMERCDVEISPWVPDEVRKTLERRVRQEQEADKVKLMYAAEVQRKIEEDIAARKRAEEQAAEKKRLDEAAALQKSVEEKAEEKRQLEQLLEEKIEEAKESLRLELETHALMEANSINERLRAMEKALEEQTKASSGPAPSQKDSRASSRTAEVPLGTLLKNYILVLLCDPRNFVILLLGASLVCMTMNINLSSMFQLPLPSVVDMPNEVMLLSSVAPVVITSTATTTATAFATVTYTQTATLSVTTSSVVEEVMPIASSPLVVDKEVMPTASSPLVVDKEVMPIASSPSVVDEEEVPLKESLIPLPIVDTTAKSAEASSLEMCPVEITIDAPVFFCAI